MIDVTARREGEREWAVNVTDDDGNIIASVDIVQVPKGVRVDVLNADATLAGQVIARP